MSAKLITDFVGETMISLNETSFQSNVNSEIYRSVRGKTAGAFIGYGTFQWTSAVTALSILLFNSRISMKSGITLPLSGVRGSLACSLDESISKETTWLSEMFGSNACGRPYARSIFLRTNSGLKRAGPVTLTLNPRILPPENIFIKLGGKDVTDEIELLSLRARILRGQSNTNHQSTEQISEFCFRPLANVA